MAVADAILSIEPYFKSRKIGNVTCNKCGHVEKLKQTMTNKFVCSDCGSEDWKNGLTAATRVDDLVTLDYPRRRLKRDRREAHQRTPLKVSAMLSTKVLLAISLATALNTASAQLDRAWPGVWKGSAKSVLEIGSDRLRYRYIQCDEDGSGCQMTKPILCGWSRDGDAIPNSWSRTTPAHRDL